MNLAQLRRASQITLPQEVKNYLHVNEGDYLEFALENGRAFLSPVSVQRKDVAWDNLFNTLQEVKTNATIVTSDDDILSEIKAIRQSKK